MPDDTYLVGYADDIAAIITARDTEDARRKLNQVMIRAQMWLDAKGLKLATEKTELVLLTKKHIPTIVDMRTITETLRTQKVVNYLGVRIDSRLTYWAQIQHAAKKASIITSQLSRLMSNIGGPRQEKRKLLMSTTLNVLLYGAELWADTLTKSNRRKSLEKVYRTAALRVASAYRTVSGEAVYVISGNTPIDLLAFERKKMWTLKKQGTDAAATKEEIKSDTLEQWQARWEQGRHGRWTARLIRNIKEWSNREHGEVDFYTTQMLSGHGYFRKYLYKMGKVEEPSCIYNDAIEDDAEHTFFKCTRWQTQRNRLYTLVGTLNADNIITVMLQNEENWKNVKNYIENVLRIKKRDLDAGNDM